MNRPDPIQERTAATESIRQALADHRWETARRLAIGKLEDDENPFEIRMLLHEALRRLGDLRAARACLEELRPGAPDQRFDLNLRLAEDCRLLAECSHYRISKEKRDGLSIDEYVDKYNGLAEDALDALAPMAKTPDQIAAVQELRRQCDATHEKHQAVKPEFSELPDDGNCVIRGRLLAADGTPAADVRLVLGLEVSTIERPPRPYADPEMHYSVKIGKQRARETRTDTNGKFCFADLPAGQHEFLAACLDPLDDPIATLFLAHNLAVDDAKQLTVQLTLREWTSAARVPVGNPFNTKREINGNECRLVHVEELRNPFYYDFPRQVIHFPLPAGVPADPALLALLCSAEPDQPLPFQIDGSQVSFFAELPQLSDRVYALYESDSSLYHEHPCSCSGSMSRDVLKVSRLSGTHGTAEKEDMSRDAHGTIEEEDGDTAILSTGRADFRIPWGEGSDSTPPILAVRGADDCWRGQGRWVLPEDVAIDHWQTQVQSEGPIATSIAITYQLSTNCTYEIRLTAQRDEPMLLVHEISPAVDGVAFEFSLAEFSGGRGFLHWTPENGNLHWSTLSAADRELARLQESVPWWIPPAGFGYAMTADSLEQQDYIGVVTLRRGDWIDRRFAAITHGPGDDQRELDWPFPEMVGSTISMITAHTDQDGDAYFRFKCFDGERRWGLLVSTFDRNDGRWKEISSMQHKNSSPRLQEFKDWHLDEQDRLDRPFVLTRRGRLVSLREKGKTPTFAPWRRKIADWQQLEDSYDRDDCRGLNAVLCGDPVELWSLKKEIAGVAHIRSRMTLLGRDYGDMYSPVGGRPITPWAEVYDLIAPTGVFTAAEERITRAFLMLMGHMYMQPDLMNWKFNSRNANFEADRVDIVGSVGLAFHGNPDSARMIDHARTLMKQSLEVYCTPGSGKWYENPACYYLHASTCRLNLAFHLWEHGIYDSSEIPRLKDFLSWALNIVTPPYPVDYDVMRTGESFADAKTARHVPPIGDHATLGKTISENIAVMSKVFRERDPEFADHLLWLFHTGNVPGNGASRVAQLFAALEEEDLKPAPAPKLTSRRLEGFGSVFRGNVGQDDEFYLLFKLGPGGYRYHRTEGSILLIQGGRPLIFDGGEAGETWRHTTLSFGDTHMPLAPGHLERFHTFDAVDFAQGVNPKALEPGEPDFLSDCCEHQLVELAHERFNEPNPANSRSLLSVKGEYIILHDQLDLPANQLTHWHLQAVADDHTVNPTNGYRFSGRYDMDLQVLLPNQTFENEFITQQPTLEYRLAPDDSFSMRRLQLSATSPDSVLAVIRPLSANTPPVTAKLLTANAGPQGVVVQGPQIDDIHWLDRDRLDHTQDRIRFAGRYGSVLRHGDKLCLVIQDGRQLAVDNILLETNGPAVSLEIIGQHAVLQAEGLGHVNIEGLSVPVSVDLDNEKARVELAIC